MSIKDEVSLPAQRICTRCKFVSSQEVCKACVLLEGLNKGLPKLGIGKSSKAKKMLEEYNARQTQSINILEQVVNDLEDVNMNTSRLKTDRCKSKEIINNQVNGANEEIKCGKKNCCSNKNDIQNTDKERHSKLNHLLEEYELNEKDKLQHCIQDSDDEATPINGQEEDDACSSSCGTMGFNF